MALKELVITRTFNAPRSEVWRMWTEAEGIKLWWGPKEYSAPIIKTDFRVGGKYLYAMKDPDGTLLWSTGSFKEIKPQEKIVATDSFSNEKGEIIPPTQYGMPSDMPKELELIVTFTEENGRTVLNLHHKSFPSEIIEMCRQGWMQSLDKLETALTGRESQQLSL